MLDLAVGCPLLAATLPLQLLIALLIRIDSPGPALFAQERLRLNRDRFRFYKFRTMFVNARARFPHLYDYEAIVSVRGDSVLKEPGDPRLTRVGRWLRRMSLDELPNLWHVVRGELSLVGPRPELPELLGCYAPDQLHMFLVKPGLTGLSQTRGRSRLTVHQTIVLDNEYARRACMRLDLAILSSTVWAVLSWRDSF
jgi:lipopolysaccharide/colanic/teichoic acid biosynthesis glycosyltransferase